jgi:hypothetical protein
VQPRRHVSQRDAGVGQAAGNGRECRNAICVGRRTEMCTSRPFCRGRTWRAFV